MTTNPQKIRSLEFKNIIFPIILLFAAFAYFRSFAFFGINLLDEGYLLNPALRVMRGQVPGRDFYHYYPPGSFYLFAALMKIFGVGMAVERYSFVVLRSFEALLAWRILKYHSNKWWALFGYFGILLVPGPAHKTFVGLSILVLLNVYSWWAEKLNNPRSLACGAAIGAIFMFRQDVAVYGLITGAAAVMLSANTNAVKIKSTASMLLGIFIALIIPSILLAFQGAFGDVLQQIFIAGEKGTKANAIPFPMPWTLSDEGLRGGLRIIAFWTAPIIYLLMSIYLVFEFKKSGAISNRPIFMEIIVCVMGIFCLAIMKNRADLPHLYQAIVPVFVAVPMLCYHLFERSGKIAWKVAPLIPIFIFAAQSFGDNQLHHGTISVMKGRDTPLEVRGCTLVLDRYEAEEVKGVLEFIAANTRAGASILVVPHSSLFYFLTDRNNPTRFDLLRRGRWENAEQEAAVLADIVKATPEAVIYQDLSKAPERVVFREYAPQIDDYIHKNFCEAGRSVTYILMLPADSPKCENPK